MAFYLVLCPILAHVECVIFILWFLLSNCFGNSLDLTQFFPWYRTGFQSGIRENPRSPGAAQKAAYITIYFLTRYPPLPAVHPFLPFHTLPCSSQSLIWRRLSPIPVLRNRSTFRAYVLATFQMSQKMSTSWSTWTTQTSTITTTGHCLSPARRTCPRRNASPRMTMSSPASKPIGTRPQGLNRGIQPRSILMSAYCLSRTFALADLHSSESPYPEVRAAVASVDDPSMPVNTFRMCVLFSFKLLSQC